MTELADRGLIWNRLTSQIDADKRTQRAGIVQRLLYCRIRQIEPLQNKVDAQHPLQPHRSTTRTRGFTQTHRRDQRTQASPRHHPLHLAQKTLPARRLAISLKIIHSKGLLAHRSKLQVACSNRSLLSQY